MDPDNFEIMLFLKKFLKKETRAPKKMEDGRTNNEYRYKSTNYVVGRVDSTGTELLVRAAYLFFLMYSVGLQSTRTFIHGQLGLRMYVVHFSFFIFHFSFCSFCSFCSQHEAQKSK